MRLYSSQHRRRMSIENKYQPGAQIRVQRLNNIEIPDDKSLATVKHVDTLGTLYVEFDNGAKCNIIPDIDQFQLI